MSTSYLHGAYGEHNVVGSRVAREAQSAVIVVGTAPVNQIEGGAENVNTPILVSNIAEARKYFGYSSDWDEYTLCEAFHVFFEQRGVGPLVVINVLDPDNSDHVSESTSTTTATPSGGKITITDAEDIILDTVVLTSGDTTFVKDTDYTITYNFAKKSIVATEITSGALGTDEITATYYTILPSGVSDDDVIGATDGNGSNTGLYAIKDVYQATGLIPAFLIAPGFSSSQDVHEAMYTNSVDVNDHWDLFMYSDLPLTNGDTQLTMDTIVAYKNSYGYDKENEKVFFPMVEGTDGYYYHLSVLAMAALMETLSDNDDIPYHSSSNVECNIISNLYLGSDYTGRVWDDSLINSKLNKYGVSSAAYVGGRWAIWGAHCADYTYDDGDYINVSETNRMMLYYICNSFQDRHFEDVDRPMSSNDIESIVAEEQARLDALIQIGALTYGVASVDASADSQSDMMSGDYAFTFDVTTTPLAKSLKAVVNWVDDGFEIYFAS